MKHLMCPYILAKSPGPTLDFLPQGDIMDMKYTVLVEARSKYYDFVILPGKIILADPSYQWFQTGALSPGAFSQLRGRGTIRGGRSRFEEMRY